MKSSNRIVTVHVLDPEIDPMGNWVVYGAYDHEPAALIGAEKALNEGYQVVKVCTAVTYLAENNGGGPVPRAA